MTLRALQAIRKSVMAVLVPRALYPDRPDTPHLPIGHVSFYTTIGTGFLCDPAGIVITAGHVVTDMLEQYALFENEMLTRHMREPLLLFQQQFLAPEVRPADRPPDDGRGVWISQLTLPVASVLRDRGSDLAALYLRNPLKPPRDAWSLQLARIATSPVTLGDEVVACGYPFGEAMNTQGSGLSHPPSFSRGIVSAIIPEWSAPHDQWTHIRFDATILPGNSGGPLCDLRTGHVVGVVSTTTVLRFTDSARNDRGIPVGFPQAVPLNHVRRFLAEARTRRADAIDLRTAWLGRPPVPDQPT